MTDIKINPVVTDLPDPTPSSPLEALGWLGNTVEEVVEGLRARGIKGEPRNPSACPLANYLEEFDWWVSISEEKLFWDNFKTTTNTPPTICAFIRQFDAGDFPDLIAD